MEKLVESIKSMVRWLMKKNSTKKKKKREFIKMEKSESVKEEILSRNARKLVQETLKVADRPGKRSIS